MSETVTKTYGECIAFLNASSELLNQSNGKEPVKLTKFTYAVGKMQKKVQRLYDKGYSEPLEDERIKLALTAEKDTDKLQKGEILRDERGMMRYTPENLKALNQKQRELFDVETEVEPHFAAPPENLRSTLYFALLGFVIEDKEPEN